MIGRRTVASITKGAARIALLCIALPGCMTLLSSQKAEVGNDGILYCLPQPAISVTPSASGVPTVELIHLPDPDQTYTLETTSIVSSYTLDVQLDDCFLTKVSLDAKSDAVLVEAAKAAGEIAKTKFETDKEIAAAAETANQAAAAKIAAAEDELITADATLKALEELKREHPDQVSDKQLFDAKLALKLAQAKYKKAIGAINARSSIADAPIKDAATTSKAWGPVYFQILQGIDKAGDPTVDLIAMRFPDGSAQMQFDTISLKDTEDSQASVSFGEEGNQAVRDEAGNLSITFTVLTGDLENVSKLENEGISTEAAPRKMIAPAEPVLSADKKTVSINLPKDLPAGNYLARFAYKAQGASDTVALLFAVQ